MNINEAKEKICPLMSTGFSADTHELRNNGLIKINCICNKCMFWEETVVGRKEIDRKMVPYDMTRGETQTWISNITQEGYENIGNCGGFSDIYVKYEEANEGYCKMVGQRP